MEGKKKNRMVRGQVNAEGVSELSHVVLQVPLGQGQSEVQGRCPVETVNCLYAKDQVIYSKMNV